MMMMPRSILSSIQTLPLLLTEALKKDSTINHIEFLNFWIFFPLITMKAVMVWLLQQIFLPHVCIKQAPVSFQMANKHFQLQTF